jgi:hypothetical protein
LDLLLLLHHNGVLDLDLLLLRLLFLLELIYRLLQLVDVPLRVFYFSLGHVELVKHLRGLGTLIRQGLLKRGVLSTIGIE